jgi:Uncharacterized protein predicted to be involved in DNA repair (RAMP superfamily)
MTIKIKMKLLSDAVFGSGISVPGGEDISILCDCYGFPYYKGSTFKGIFREEMIRYLGWKGNTEQEIDQKTERLLGKSGDTYLEDHNKIMFADFTLSPFVRESILDEIGTEHLELVTDSLSHIRMFTKLNGDGTVEEGSLHSCRCINKNLIFYSQINCQEEDRELIENVLKLVKWVGSMRNRGFGKVQLSVI